VNLRLVWSLRVAWSLIATALLALPLVSTFRHPDLPMSFAVLLVALVALAAWRPPVALVAVCAMLPFVHGLQVFLGPPIGGAEITECLAASFLCGAAPRVMAPGQPRDGRLGYPALMLGLLVAASAIVDLAGRWAADPAHTLVRDLWAHVTSTSYFSPQPFFELHQSIRWIETLVLAVFVERIARGATGVQTLAVRVWLAAGAAAASFSIIRLVEASLRSPTPFDALRGYARTLRISVFLPDPNAAGSLLVLFAVPAVIIGIERRSAWLLGVVSPVVLTALWLTKSRAAVAALVIVVGIWLLARLVRARRYAPAAVVVAATLAMGAFIWTQRPATNSPVNEALFIRGELGKVALDITKTAPVWGVGVGHFLAESRTYIEPGLIAMFPQAGRGENAHNNFLQVLAELGVTGLIAFVWVTIGGIWPIGRGAAVPSSPERAGVAAGVAAFLVTALLGHPLLLAQAAFGAFLALGLAAGLIRGTEVFSTDLGRSVPEVGFARLVAWLAIGAILVALPWRVWSRVSPTEEPEVSGASAVLGEIDGVAYRRAELQSTWIVPVETRVIVLPLRWDQASATDCETEVTLDGVVANRVKPTALEWMPVRFVLPPPDRGVYLRRLALRVSDARCALLVGAIEAKK
jgi:hypothetical protein